MRNVALDLGVKKTSYCEVANGKVVQRATVTQVESLSTLLGTGEPPARVAIEACREAWFVHDLLMSWGNEVLIVDTTRCRQVGVGQHQRKTDKLDAEVLARAVEHGGIPQAHVLSPARRELRRVLAVRRSLVETRANCVTTVRGLARECGKKIPSCATDNFVDKARSNNFDRAILSVIGPLLTVIESVENELMEVETRLSELCAKEPLFQLLTTAPGVGLVVAACVVSVLDDARRFRKAHEVESYAGLVPSEKTTGGKRRLGSISKAGNSYLRALLVQAAWVVLRSKNKSDPLYLWGTALTERRGKRIAVVAVARRLLGILWAMWKDGTVYDPEHLAQQGTRGLRGAVQSLEQQQVAMEIAAKKRSVSKPAAPPKRGAKASKTRVLTAA